MHVQKPEINEILALRFIGVWCGLLFASNFLISYRILSRHLNPYNQNQISVLICMMMYVPFAEKHHNANSVISFLLGLRSKLVHGRWAVTAITHKPQFLSYSASRLLSYSATPLLSTLVIDSKSFCETV